MKKRILLPHLLRYLLLLVGLGCCLTLSAQEFANFSNIQYLTSDEGLSQQEITCMLQDRQGFLWIGTRGGLNRYDGYSFKVFQNEIGNANSLINNSIESLFEDSEGNIWIGTKANGLSIYNPQTDRFTHLNEGMEEGQRLIFNRVISIAESGNGDIWIGTWEDGVIVKEKGTGKFRHYLENVKVSAIKKTQDGKIYLAANRGLYLFSKSGELLGHYRSSPSHAFVDITEERVTGKIYLGTWNQGLFEFDPDKETFRQFNKQVDKLGTISSNNAYRIFQDNKDRIWVGTWGAGLNLFDPQNGTFTRYNLVHENLNRGKELYEDVLSIFQDKSGIIWFGTNGGGICKVDERSSQFDHIRNSTEAHGVPREPIWGMMKDSEGILWVGSKGSEYLYYSKDGQNFFKIAIPEMDSQNAWF